MSFATVRAGNHRFARVKDIRRIFLTLHRAFRVTVDSYHDGSIQALTPPTGEVISGQVKISGRICFIDKSVQSSLNF